MTARPFLKWAGGKRTLEDAILARLLAAAQVSRYVEPFVGGGAIFFRMREERPSLPACIADSNASLMNTYVAVRDDVAAVIQELARHAELHARAHFYAVRRESPKDAGSTAARFIYLNRTCYNGLWRENRKGEFNVPMGCYANPKILDEANLRNVSAALRDVEIRCVDFEQATSDCGRGDLVYLDPPYHPLSATSSFTSYTASGFGPDEQARLARVFARLSAEGAHVVLSNSDSTFIRQLYASLEPRPVIDSVDAPRAINSKGKSRGPVKEVLVSSP